MKLTATVRGLDLTIGSIEGLGTAAAAGALAGVTKGLAIAELAARKLIGASDHSLADLAMMGHPYARRNPHSPHADPIVHVQTGRYLGALKVTQPQGRIFAGSPAIIQGRMGIEGDEEMEKLDRWLQEGTLHMIARPWMAYIVRNFGTEMMQVVVAEIQNAVARDKARTGSSPARAA